MLLFHVKIVCQQVRVGVEGDGKGYD